MVDAESELLQVAWISGLDGTDFHCGRQYHRGLLPVLRSCPVARRGDLDARSMDNCGGWTANPRFSDLLTLGFSVYRRHAPAISPAGCSLRCIERLKGRS